MRTTPVTLDEGEVDRRAQAWHALAAMQGQHAASHGLLFSRTKPENGVTRTEGALHVSGHVPVDCLKLYDVMD